MSGMEYIKSREIYSLVMQAKISKTKRQVN